MDHTQQSQKVRAVREPSWEGRWEKFCLQSGAHPTPCSAPAPCHQPDLMPVCSSIEKTRNSEPQFQPDRLQEGSRPLDPCEKCLLVLNPGFTLMLFSAKELKNHVIYTYTSVSIENVCTSGKMALPTHAGDSSPEGCCRFCPPASGSLSLSLQGVKPQSSQVFKNQEQIVAGEEFLLSPQPWLPALTHCMDGKREGGEKLPSRTCRNTETSWERKPAQGLG